MTLLSEHAGDAFEYLMHGARPKRTPRELWIAPDHLGKLHFGVVYSDGERVEVGELDASRCRDAVSIQAQITEAYRKAGIDVEAIDRAKPQPQTMSELREALRRRMESDPAFARHMPGSGSYQQRTRPETPGAAFYASTMGGGQSWTRDWFRSPEEMEELRRAATAQAAWGTWADERADPDRAKAVARCRRFKDIIARPTTNEGERDNARAALDRLRAKHGIAEAELG